MDNCRFQNLGLLNPTPGLLGCRGHAELSEQSPERYYVCTKTIFKAQY